ncbi:uncharacterized protein LOC144347236 [Saccoglossus kowalevskii]
MALPTLVIFQILVKSGLKYALVLPQFLNTRSGNAIVLMCESPESYIPVVALDESKTVKEGDAVSINCSTLITEANPAASEFQWIRNSAVEQTTEEFTIYSVARSDAGLYSCWAFNYVYDGSPGKGESTTVLVVQYQKILCGSIFSSKITSPCCTDRTTEHAQNTLIRLDSDLPNAFFDRKKGCSTVSYAANSATPQLDWLKENDSGTRDTILQKKGDSTINLIDDDRYTFGEDADLVINDTIYSDSGKYVCQVSGLPDSPGEDTIFLFVGYTPIIIKITSEDGKTTFSHGDSVRLNCSADGKPSPLSFNWTLDNGETPDTEDDGSIAVFNIYEKVTAICRASNVLGVVVESVILDVESKFCCVCPRWCVLLILLILLVLLGGGGERI